MRRPLILHPRSRCDAVTSLEVEAERAGAGLTLRYLLTGDVARLAVPPAAGPGRVDGLWNHTCFEAFLGAEGGAYREFNFAPSTEWAAYGFGGYRSGMAPLEIEAPSIGIAKTADTLEVRVGLALPATGPLRLGLTAVVEEVGGRLSYWALRHPAEQPDFHHAGGFMLEL